MSTVVQDIHLGYAPALVVGSSLRDDYATRHLREIHKRRPGWYNYVLMNLPDERSKEYYRELGLRVMWFDPSPGFSEIPELLNRITGASAQAKDRYEATDFRVIPAGAALLTLSFHRIPAALYPSA